MSSRHAESPRGLIHKEQVLKATPWRRQGRFGRLVGEGTATFEDKALAALAAAMVAGFDPPKDGPDREESGIPALYTYFGQFVDHDLVFDPATSFQKKKDVNALEDFRTPSFDLDSVYGRGPGDQPYMYDAGGAAFELGAPLSLGVSGGAHDLLRSPAGRALIGDPRNDENVIISQLQGLFQRAHNRLALQLQSFDEAQDRLRRHYQYVVLYDFLPRIVSAKVLDALKTNGRYDPKMLKLVNIAEPFMPVEFSGACYRYGHSMVRPGYRLNDSVLLPIFPVFPRDARAHPEGLTGARHMISNWGIDWGRFIDIDTRKYDGTELDKFKRLQFAYRIDTSLVDPLGALPPAIAANPASLALRNLQRGRDLALPSAQEMARAMKEKEVEVELLDDEDIIIGAEKGRPITAIHPSFKGNCPLWTYVLAEAMRDAAPVEVPVTENGAKAGSVVIDTPRLGPIGGRVVAEVIVGLMAADPSSILYDGWQPASGPGYALKDLVAFALG